MYEPGSFVPLAQLDSVAGDSDSERRSEVHHIHTDHLGTPNEVTDQEGEIVWASEYKAWGNVVRVAQAAPKRHSVVAVEVEAANDVAQFQPIRFLGQYHDTETGLNYNRFRYYDGDSGRYISLDPIGLAGGSNSYQYAPNPSGWTDPLGLMNNCACSPGELLRQKHGHLSGPQRQSIINERLEKVASDRLTSLEQSIPNAHFQGRHGAQTTLNQQYERAVNGIDPITNQPRHNNSGSLITPDSSRFLSARDQMNAIERAKNIYRRDGQISAEKPITFRTQAGEGYRGLTGIYDVSYSARVWFNKAGQPITAFPKLGE